VVTAARSDYGIYQPILRNIQAAPDLDLRLIVTGMHLSPEFVLTVKEIEADGFKIDQHVDMLFSSGTPEGISKSVGVAVLGFAQAFAQFQPDILVVLGDRFEMLGAAVAVLPFTIPVAHIHGGESTEGSIDEPIRHSITKMSHIHFVSTEQYRNRVIQLGEEPWRVMVSGAPGLDNLRTVDWLDLAELERIIGMSLQVRPLLVTYHPVTLEYAETGRNIAELLAAIEMADMPVVFTYPNADTYGYMIIQAIDQFVQTHERARVVDNLGTQGYFSLMKHAAAMVGNSSSGIIEAASFELPVVNVGRRQRGRVHDSNVIDTDCSRNSIVAAIHQVIKPEFFTHLKGMRNPYGDGYAAERIVDKLRTVSLNKSLILKRFHDLPLSEAE
jgi:UDP-hydrolysing UDP-N-acetyl-D-glucosamine 2-epimerase